MFFFLRIRLPRGSTRTDTRYPCRTLFLSLAGSRQQGGRRPEPRRARGLQRDRGRQQAPGVGIADPRGVLETVDRQREVRLVVPDRRQLETEVGRGYAPNGSSRGLAPTCGRRGASATMRGPVRAASAPWHDSTRRRSPPTSSTLAKAAAPLPIGRAH